MPDGTERARSLRRRQTSAERLLWSRLRNRGIAGWKFKRQVPFGRFVVDFCCADGHLIVELDGPSHVDAGERDGLRTAQLERFGYVVKRFWNQEVFDDLDGVCDTILRELSPVESPHPALSPPGRGFESDDIGRRTSVVDVPLPGGERAG